MIRELSAAAFVTTMATAAAAAPVNLSTWEENGHGGNLSAGDWNVSGDADTVTQTINGDPTIFFEAGTNAQGTSISGTISSGGLDDDFFGFVLGYQADELNGPADFWLVDWKQRDQGFSGRQAEAGLALSHVTGDLSSANALDFWDHEGTVEEVARGSSLADTGWVRNQVYEFDLTFTDSLIEVFVDGVLEISFAGTFTDGAYGFYNYSQNPVIYAGVTADVLPPPPPPSAVPLPAGLPLLLVGLGALGIARRKRG